MHRVTDMWSLLETADPPLLLYLQGDNDGLRARVTAMEGKLLGLPGAGAGAGAGTGAGAGAPATATSGAAVATPHTKSSGNAPCGSVVSIGFMDIERQGKTGGVEMAWPT